MLDHAAFEQAIGEFYAMLGWDAQGKPTPSTLYDRGLEWVLRQER